MKKKRKKLGIWLLFMSLMLVGIYTIIVTKDSTIKASTVVKKGNFGLSAKNSWSAKDQKPFAKLEWDDVGNLTQNGYKLYQSTDGWKNQESVSLKYDKPVKVLNVYPINTDSATIIEYNVLEKWVESALKSDKTNSNLKDLIKIDSISLYDFNQYIKNNQTTSPDGINVYDYDVLSFGYADSNGGWSSGKSEENDLTEKSYGVVDAYIKSGRGVLFGHDTIAGTTSSKKYFTQFYPLLGLYPASLGTHTQNGSRQVQIVKQGYLMEYPFKIDTNVLKIPLSHNVLLSDTTVGNTWMEFTGNLEWQGNKTIYQTTLDGKVYRAGWYLKTNGNVAMIQTGHSNDPKKEDTTSEDEQKVIVNLLYNLAQISLENNANDQTVEDKVVPNKPTLSMNCEGITIDAVDQGTEYQWKVEADTKDLGTVTSDIVAETITSNIAGYFYVIDENQKLSSLKNSVESKKEAASGLILKEIYSNFDSDQNVKGIFVDPETDETEYNKKGIITDTDRYADAGKYLHVVAVDRSGNVSEVTDMKIGEIPSDFSYEIERNKDTLKLVNLDFKKVDKKMKSMEITVPKNIKIENYGDVEKFVLPDTWETFDNTNPNTSEGQDDITGDYRKYTFSMKENNSESTITSFLKNLTFVISGDKDKQGSIKIIMGEKVVASTIGKDGKQHFYIFEPFTGTDHTKSITWMQAYNKAKTHKWRGLTGYLATVTSVEEHNFIYEKIAKDSGWLGGTRMVMADKKSKINDEDSISENIADYYFTPNVTAADYVYTNELGEDWYWTDGPEAGQVFFDGPIYQKDADKKGWGKTAKDMYSGFNNPEDRGATNGGNEPNSYSVDNNVGEYVLEFARKGSGKYWNDFDYERTKTGLYGTGYYVEFSEYGDQKEEALDETELSWCSRIPQKVKLEAYDVYDKNNPTRLPEKDIIYDQNLRIGSKFDTADDLTIPYYKYIEMRETDDTERVTTEYIISDICQTGKIIYSNRTGIIHVRQVVKSPRDELVLPNNGYSTLKNVKDDATFTVLSQMNLTTPSTVKNEEDNFTTYNLTFDEEVSSYYKYTALIPMYYKLEGYAISLTKDDHLTVDIDKSENWIPISFKLKREYWVTVYITPDIELDAYPSLYHWNYKTNDLGKIISSKE